MFSAASCLAAELPTQFPQRATPAPIEPLPSQCAQSHRPLHLFANRTPRTVAPADLVSIPSGATRRVRSIILATFREQYRKTCRPALLVHASDGAGNLAVPWQAL